MRQPIHPRGCILPVSGSLDAPGAGTGEADRMSKHGRRRRTAAVVPVCGELITIRVEIAPNERVDLGTSPCEQWGTFAVFYARKWACGPREGHVTGHAAMRCHHHARALAKAGGYRIVRMVELGNYLSAPLIARLGTALARARAVPRE